MLSCLAMGSMGSMVPRMELRKGTIPNTLRERKMERVETEAPSEQVLPPEELA